MDIRVLLVGDDGLAREGIAALLSGIDSVTVTGSLPTETVLRGDALDWQVEVIVADAQNAEPDLLQRLSTFEIPIVALIPDQRLARECLVGSVRAVLLRQTTRDRLIATIRAAAHQLVIIDEVLLESVVRPSSPAITLQETLTTRESQVLHLLAAALSNKEIASRLGISESTAKFHVNSILAKLAAQNRTEAIVIAARLGLITL